MGTLATKADTGSHINLDAAAARKQEHMDNCDSPKEPLKDIAALEDVTDDADDHDLRDTSQGDLSTGDGAGSGPKELGKETRLEDVASSAPLRRTQRSRKKTRKAFELDL